MGIGETPCNSYRRTCPSVLVTYLQTSISSRDPELLTDLGCVVRCGQHQQKKDFLHQRDDGFAFAGCLGGDMGPFWGQERCPATGRRPRNPRWLDRRIIPY